MVAPTEGSRLPARQVWTPPTPPRLGKQRRGAVSLRQGPPRLSHAPRAPRLAETAVWLPRAESERSWAPRSVRVPGGGRCVRAPVLAAPRAPLQAAARRGSQAGPCFLLSPAPSASRLGLQLQRADPGAPTQTCLRELGTAYVRRQLTRSPLPARAAQCARRCPWCWRSSPPSASLRLLLSVVLSPVPAMMSSMPGTSSPRNSP